CTTSFCRHRRIGDSALYCGSGAASCVKHDGHTTKEETSFLRQSPVIRLEIRQRGGASTVTTGNDWHEVDAILAREFGTLPEMLRLHASLWPNKAALVQGSEGFDYATLDRAVDRAAAAMQRDGVRAGDVIAICALNSIRYAIAFVAALRAGAAVAPLAPLSTAESLELMLANCDAKILFADSHGNGVAAAERSGRALLAVGLDDATRLPSFDHWLAPEGSTPAAVRADPEAVFNIIYSSGTTGAPKGIVHANELRWRQIIG